MRYGVTKRGRRRAVMGFTLVLAALTSGLWIGPTGEVSAENGELLAVADVLAGTRIVDITQDTADASFWILGADGSDPVNHRIYNVELSANVLRATVENPHDPGVLPNITINRGIAYRPLSNTLLVLSSVGERGSQSFIIAEQKKPDEPDPPGGLSVFALSALDQDASLFGLTYDLFTREFWTVDTVNDRILRLAATGEITEELIMPGKDDPSTVLRGQGVSYDLDGFSPRLHIAYGDIFTAGPSKVREVDTEGVLVDGRRFASLTGVEVSLDAVPSSDLLGIQTFSDQLGRRRVAVTARDGPVYVLERSVSTPQAPTELQCALTLNNQVRLTWKNHGGGLGGAYGDSLQIVRNGVPLATISGDSTSFLDKTATPGSTTYTVRGQASGGILSDESCECSVRVGAGGLVTWTPFPGVSIYDVTENPVTKEVLVTDDLGQRIYRFDRDLQFVDDVPAPFTGQDSPGGITYVPSITLGFPPETHTELLAVAEVPGNRVRIVSADSPEGPVITTIAMRLDDVPNPQIGGLAYAEATQQFFLREMSSDVIYTFSNTGSLQSSCAPPFPPFLIDAAPDFGMTYDPIQEALLVVFEDGFVRELFPQGGCTLSGFEFPLAGLGEGFDSPRFTGGIKISDGTLLSCGRKSNALFRVLMFPFSPDFIRGDFDGDSAVNITDARNLADYLFRGGTAPACGDAADVNDDGFLDVSDPVYLLFALFVPGSAAPPAPFPEPGKDPTFRDDLGCAQ